MKSFRFLLMAGLIALGFGACSDEVDVPKGGEELSGNVYMSFDLKLPTSRSATDENDGQTNSNANPDYEVGHNYENAVSNIKVVLATLENGKYTMLAESNQNSMVGSGSNYTVTFQSDDFEGQAKKTVYVFVVCNPAADFKANDLFEGYGSVTANDLTLGESIAKKNAFLMTNAELSKAVTIPEDLKPYNSPSYPFDLGVVKVERTAARFDYKSGGTNDTYRIQDSKTVNGKVRPSVSIQLTDMALVNMSKNYYWLRRVADATDETLAMYDANKITLCGVETPRNYVVDTDATDKLNGNAISFHYSSTNGNVNVDPTTLIYTPIDDITGENGTDDNWKGEDNDGYKIWRYVTENTLPSVSSQKNKYSTGVVFKGKMVQGTEDKCIDLLAGNKAYVFNDVLYGSWEQVKEAAELKNTNPETLVDPVLNTAYQIANATVKDNESDPDKTTAVSAGFTVYEKDSQTNEFNVYYYYWNRHNDNQKPNDMGIMEFAVVRNNVYKLSVTAIDRFGHPGEPTGKPDDPDEDNKVYFRVGVQVLPWVVRVNNIEF